MQQKVLLVCNYFAPDHTIAAVRTSKIAKYLKENGYEIEVLTEKKMGEEDTLLKNETAALSAARATTPESSRLWYAI